MNLVSKTDLPNEERSSKGQPGLNWSPFLGVWVNTNEEGLARVTKLEILERNGTAAIRVFGSREGEPCDWGEVTLDMFADSVNSDAAMSFSGIYDFDFVNIYLQANLKYGTLVLATCNKFRDGSPRSDYYTREFFYRPEN